MKPVIAIRQAETDVVSDENLIEQTAQGDICAFESLIERHQTAALRVAFRFVGDSAESEDLVQEAFFRVFRNAKHYNHTARFRTWFYHILMNLCRDRLKKKKPLLFGDLPELASDAPDPCVAMDRTSRFLLVAAAIADLPQNQRLSLILCHFEEMSYREAAAVLAISEKAIESLLVRARRTLRITLAGLR